MISQDKIDPDGIRDDHVPYDPAVSRLHIYADDRQQLANFQTPVLLHANNPHERLFVAALDGTGNDKIHDPDHETNGRMAQNTICPVPGTGVQSIKRYFETGESDASMVSFPPRRNIERLPFSTDDRMPSRHVHATQQRH